MSDLDNLVVGLFLLGLSLLAFGRIRGDRGGDDEGGVFVPVEIHEK